MKSVVYFNKNHRKDFWLNNKDQLTLISLYTFKGNVREGGKKFCYSLKNGFFSLKENSALR